MVNYISYKDVGQGTNTVLKTVSMQPGIRKDLTRYQAEGGWIDSDKIRFRNGRAEKIGGWVSEVVQQVDNEDNNNFTGVSRNMLAWAALDSSQYLAVGGSSKIEILSSGQIYDVTPIRTSGVTVHAFGTVQGSDVVTVTVAGHGLAVGDWIVVTAQNEPYNGIMLYNTPFQYLVQSVPDGNTFTIIALQFADTSERDFSKDFSSAFNNDEQDATTTTLNEFSGAFSSAFAHNQQARAFSSDFNNDFGGGTLTVTMNFLLPSGSIDNGNLTGYGGGTWNTPGLNGGGYGLPRNGVGGVNLRKWALDNWGQDLLANPSGGTIYQWVKANGLTTVAQPISNAPANVNFMLVAEPSRFLVAFGCNVVSGGVFDPLNIRWATEETLTDWTPTQFNTAGEFRIPTGNAIIGAIQTSHEIFIFTDVSVYSMTFLGANDPTNSIFQFTLLGTNISTVSPTSFMTLNGAVYWMGLDNFYMYNGIVSIIPNTIARYIFAQDGEGRYNVAQKEKIFTGINKEFNEIWWFYPRFYENEVSHYVKFNYLENVWDVGSMDRTVWLDKGIFPNPLAISADGTLFSHENGFDDDSQPLEAFITSAYFDIDDGEQLTFVDKIIPDLTLQPNRAIEITVFTKKYPNPSAEITTKGPYNFDDTGSKINLRARGRQIALDFRAIATGASFALGKIRIASEIDGER